MHCGFGSASFGRAAWRNSSTTGQVSMGSPSHAAKEGLCPINMRL